MLHINRYPVWPDGTRKKQSGFGPLSGTLIRSYDATACFDPSTLATDPDYGTPQFLWINGDGATPRISPNPALALTATGAGSIINNGTSPFQYPSGADVLMEQYDGAVRRTTGIGGYSLDPTDPVNNDVVIAVKAMMGATAASQALLSTYRNAPPWDGWVIYFNVSNYCISFSSTANLGGVVANSYFPVYPYSPFIFILVMDRTGNNIYPWGNNYQGTAVGDNGNTIAGAGTALAGDISGGPISAGSRIEFAAMWYGAGIAATWMASTNRLIRRLSCESMGLRETVSRRVFNFNVVTPAAESGARVFRDHNSRWWMSAAGAPIAGNPLGMVVEANRVNRCLRNVNSDSTGDYTATGGVFTRVNDAVALAAINAQCLGPMVYQLANATGVDRYVYNDYSATAAPWSLQVMARYVAGSGARLGWWDVSASTFTDLAAVGDSYVVSYVNGSTPPDTDCRWCLKIPDGCTLNFIAQGMELGSVASLLVYSYNSALRFTGDISLTEDVPSNTSGSYLATVAPARWSGVSPGGLSTILTQNTGGGAEPRLLMAASAAAGWLTGDGTVDIQTVAPYAPADGVYVDVWTAWRSAPNPVRQYIQQGITTVASLVTGAYDTTKTGYVTVLEARTTVSPMRLKKINIRSV